MWSRAQWKQRQLAVPDHEEPHSSRLNEGVKWASNVIIGAGKPGGKRSSRPGDGGRVCLRATWATAGLRLPGKGAPSCQLKSTELEAAFGWCQPWDRVIQKGKAYIHQVTWLKWVLLTRLGCCGVTAGGQIPVLSLCSSVTGRLVKPFLSLSIKWIDSTYLTVAL